MSTLSFLRCCKPTAHVVQRRALLVACTIALALAPQRQLVAQTATRIAGHVRSATGAPLADATVSIVARDSATQSTRTDAAGAYSIALPGTAGPYTLSAALLGYTRASKQVSRIDGGGSYAPVDFALQPSVQRLATTTVRAQRPRATRSDREGAGVGEPGSVAVAATGLTGDLTGDIAAAMATIPGISITPDANGGLPVISAFGLSGSDNSLTLNGMNFGAGSIPRDGVQLRVAQSTYDPSRGGFSGVQTILRLPRGGNLISTGLHLTAEDPVLQGNTPTAAQLGTQYARQIVSGSVNGPLVEDKAYYNSSFQFSRRQSDLVALSSLNASALQSLGISVDSSAKLISSASVLGIPLSNGAVPGSRLLTNASALTRFDWAPNATNRAGSMLFAMVGGNYAENAGTRSGATALPSHGGDSKSWSLQLQVTSSRFIQAVLNEANISVVATSTQNSPYVLLPDARVLVTSAFADGSAGSATLRAGGNPNAENRSHGSSLQLRDDVSWFTIDGKHQFKVTFDGRIDHDVATLSGNRLGAFTYNSLADFSAGRAASFTRTLGVRETTGQQLLGALGLGSIYRPAPQWRIQYGVRLEGNQFGDAPALNRDVLTAFGRSTSSVPNAITIAPMVGFTRQYTKRGGGSFTGGVREYVSTLSSQAVENVVRQTGLPDAVQQLACIGAAVPTPQWRDYSTSVSAIPITCADGSTGTSFSQTTPNVAAYANEYRASRRWGAALGWQGRVMNRWVGSLSTSYSLNVQRTGSFDLNFDPTQRFVLAAESARPVFVSPTSIVTSSGATSTVGSRRVAQFAQVNELRSDLRSDARQFIVGLASIPSNRPDGLGVSTSYRVYYTFSDTRDQQRGFGGNTNGNPTLPEWGSSGQARHTFQVLGSLRIPRWATIDAFGRLTSGRHFTPMVGGDINGDGLSNDRAFIFDPSSLSGDATLAARMQSLLSTGSPSTQACLRAQLGRIASRNSCAMPWTQSLNMAITLDPSRFGFGDRGSISLVVTNLLGAADQLLHGSSKLRNWGTAGNADATLLNVRGFDPSSNRFRYDANPSFGTTSASLATGRLPFVVAVDVRLKLGPDRDAQELRAFIRPTSADGVPYLNATQIKERMDKDLQNNFEDVAKRAKTVKLTTEQVATLNGLAKQFEKYRDSVYLDLSKYLESLKGNYKSSAAKRRWHDAFVNIAHLYVIAGPRVRTLLSDEQFAALPVSMTLFFDMDEQTFRQFMATASFGSLLELITGEGVD